MAYPENAPFLFKFNLKGVFNAIARYLYDIRSCSDVKPQRLFLYPSAKCNDRCIYCGEYCRGEKVGKIDFFENKSFINQIISDIKALKLKEVHLFGGGEPFFYKDNMFYFLEELKDTDIFIKIITNGNNLNEADIKNIVRNGLVSTLALNLNTVSEEMSHKIYRNGDKHNHTLNLLESISKYRKLYNKQYPLIDIFFVLFNMNYNRIPDIISILKKFDITFFFIQPLRVYAQQHESLELSEGQIEEFKKTLPSIERLMNEANIESNTDDFKINKNLIENSRDLQCVIPSRVLFGKSKLACHMPLTTLFLYPDGSIYKCHVSGEAYNSNYFFYSSIRGFLSSKEFMDFIGKIVTCESIDICKNCQACVLNEVEEIKKIFLQLKAEDTAIQS